MNFLYVTKKLRALDTNVQHVRDLNLSRFVVTQANLHGFAIANRANGTPIDSHSAAVAHFAKPDAGVAAFIAPNF